MSWSRLRSPGVVLLVLAPVLGETLSTATPPLDLLLPWRLGFLAALYGCGALLCRELAWRWRSGPLGFALLAAAYAVYEEALIDHFWFDPRHWHATGIGRYSEVWHTNVLLATHLTVFHVTVSVGSSVFVVGRLFPDRRDTSWASTRALVVAGVVLLVVVPFWYGEAVRGPLGPMLAAVALCVGLVASAWWRRGTGVRERLQAASHPRAAGLGACAGAGAHFVLVYAVPSTGLPWPVGLAVALVPLALAAVVVRRLLGRPRLAAVDWLPVVVGVLAFFAVLDVAVGLFGRYDLSLAGLLALGALRWLSRTGRRGG